MRQHISERCDWDTVCAESSGVLRECWLPCCRTERRDGSAAEERRPAIVLAHTGVVIQLDCTCVCDCVCARGA